MKAPGIAILGVGNTLLTDEGFGIRVIEDLERLYEFPASVSLVNGGVRGFDLIDIIWGCEYLIIVDVVKKNGTPGTLYRLAGNMIPSVEPTHRSLHQIDLLTVLSFCRNLDRVPEMVILGVEPKDIETIGTELTPTTRSKVGQILCMVLAELDQLGVSYNQRSDT